MHTRLRWLGLSALVAGCGGGGDLALLQGSEGESQQEALYAGAPQGSWLWGERMLPEVNPLAFEGPAAAIGLELPAGAAPTRVRARFRLPTADGAPMPVLAQLETNPRENPQGMGLLWEWSSSPLPLACAGVDCTVDATVALQPAVAGANVYFNLYMDPAGVGQTQTVGEVFFVSLEAGGKTERWAPRSSVDVVGDAFTSHAARLDRYDLPSGLRSLSVQAAVRYQDPPGGRDDVCVYLVHLPAGNLGYERGDAVWVGKRPQTSSCPAPQTPSVGALAVRDIPLWGAPGDHLLLVEATRLDARAPGTGSSAGPWALVVERRSGQGRARIVEWQLVRQHVTFLPITRR